MALARPDESPVVLTTAEALVERFRTYLLAERGLRPNVADSYVASARPFVSRVVVGDGVDAASLSARTVTAFLSDLARSLAPKTVQGRASALRALLRLWFLDGMTDIDLSVSVQKVVYRSSGLPKGLPAKEVEASRVSCTPQMLCAAGAAVSIVV